MTTKEIPAGALGSRELEASATEMQRYKGQWGGKIETGEEMWWSEPNSALKNPLSRAAFHLDPRHHFLLRFWKNAAIQSAAPALVDYGCGTAGTTINFSTMIQAPITGLDVFETQLKIAREFASKQGSPCTFKLLEEGGKIPTADQTLDGIFSLDVLGHVKDIPTVLKEFSRALKPGGHVFLFTESNHSAQDSSIMAHLSRNGADMVSVVPEHISLFPRETLEKMFADAGLEVVERYSANVWHFFFFPKDYVLLLKGRTNHRGIYRLAWIWNRISKILPFYPWPFHVLRLALTHLFGASAFGTSYFYHLKKTR